MELFMKLLRPGPDTTVLDVGVDDLARNDEGGWATGNFFEEQYPWRKRITAVGDHPGAGFRARYPEVAFVQADGCDLPFSDREFDVCFSNAVIEHVGGRDRQRRFVAEALRVAEQVFITTPNRRFPIEVHTRLPFVHWLPDQLAATVYGWVGKPWASDLSLLGPEDLRSLFPDEVAVRLVNLRLTLVAVGRRPG
jgi:SAM-dependent methyltransferase